MNPLDDIPGLAKPLGGVFYLHGGDEFRKEEVLRALVDLHLDPATRDFNLDPLRGTEVDTETLASVLGTPPMMAEWRVVLLREVEGLASSPRSRTVLMNVLASPPPGLALIISGTAPQGSKAKFYKELAKGARSVEFQPFTAADVPGWLMARAQERFQVRMEPEAAQALGAAVGTDLGVLAQEVEKLSEFVGERRTVTLEDVEAAGIRLPAQDRWRWLDLVGDARLEEALDTLGILFAQGESGVYLVIGLATHFLRLGIVAEEGQSALEDALPPNQRWLARRLASQARKWRPVEIDAALAGLLRMDRLLKSSPVPDQHFVEEWLLTLLARKVAA